MLAFVSTHAVVVVTFDNDIADDLLGSLFAANVNEIAKEQRHVPLRTQRFRDDLR
jgi:hypothetical protein